MILYLRDRQFREEPVDKIAPIDSDGYFVIRPDREEWTDWLEHYRTKYGETILTPTQKRGFLLTRTRWPGRKSPASGSPQRDTVIEIGPAGTGRGKADDSQATRHCYRLGRRDNDQSFCGRGGFGVVGGDSRWAGRRVLQRDGRREFDSFASLSHACLP